ncbi:hypothetical protein COJ37_23315 [Bacillus cereus]|nr:hypothetical protein CN430_30610 [Bacillus cereus]PEY60242.1 hypothetical protein CN356_24935 [Bacillus cereus]PFC50820.1 hypothetical protein CN297_16675 [Bacillus cereus]PFJ89895.1 hypothetical protein COJ11_22675 [Bacillus cereus]PFK48349.1 hypothetical protein COJ14_26020 [Bacillus cereus]
MYVKKNIYNLSKGIGGEDGFVICCNSKIKKFILSSTNMEALIKSEKKQKEFVHLVQDEYKKRR